MRFRIPIKLPSLANVRWNWRTMAKTKIKQKDATFVCLNNAGEIPPPPLLITITRVGPRKLDDDNLASACKYVRDMIATAVGIDDGSPLYTWRYEQRIGKDYCVEVEITSR